MSTPWSPSLILPVTFHFTLNTCNDIFPFLEEKEALVIVQLSETLCPSAVAVYQKTVLEKVTCHSLVHGDSIGRHYRSQFKMKSNETLWMFSFQNITSMIGRTLVKLLNLHYLIAGHSYIKGKRWCMHVLTCFCCHGSSNVLWAMWNSRSLRP